jgi:peptidyl-prolyl cis-trans isomerase A (cyclophilin A)
MFRCGFLVCSGSILCSFVVGLAGCGKSGDGQANSASSAPAASGGSGSPVAATKKTASSESPPADLMVVIRTTQGDITLKLYPAKAPRTVENFLRGYAERGYYDQTIFHHVEPGRMLIGGGYTTNLERKPARAPIYNESSNGLSNRRGTVAMIREPESPHSATSEFFVNLADNPDFDFKSSDSDDVPGYCVFGEVVTGMDVVDKIAQLPTAAQGDFPQLPSPRVAIVGVQLVR